MSSINYSNGQIYCVIDFTSDEKFIDCTAQNLNKRLEWHRKMAADTTCTRPIHEHMRENPSYKYKIILLKKVSCKNKAALKRACADYVHKDGNMEESTYQMPYPKQIYMVVNSVTKYKYIGLSDGKEHLWQILKRIKASAGKEFPLLRSFIKEHSKAKLQILFLETLYGNCSLGGPCTDEQAFDAFKDKRDDMRIYDFVSGSYDIDGDYYGDLDSAPNEDLADGISTRQW